VGQCLIASFHAQIATCSSKGKVVSVCMCTVPLSSIRDIQVKLNSF